MKVLRIFLISTFSLFYSSIYAQDDISDVVCFEDEYYKFLDPADQNLPYYWQSSKPGFVVSSKEQKFLLGIGGFVNFRLAYDFKGIVENSDFVVYDIPVPGSYRTKEELMMDATSSRVFFKAVADAGFLGPITAYIETDFRGEDNHLRLRYAYLSFKSFLVGRNVTTFNDIQSSPNTLDFEGPNGYTFN